MVGERGVVMEDRLIVTYDNNSKDMPAIAIARKGGEYGITMLCMHVGKRAEDLYRILTNQDVKFEIVED